MIDFLGSVMPEEVFMNRACLHEATVADEEKPWPRRSVGLKAGVMHLNTRGSQVLVRHCGTSKCQAEHLRPT